MRRTFCLLLLVVVSMASSVSVSARQQSSPTDLARTDAEEAAAAAGSFRLLAATGPRTSPFNPPEESDIRFVVDASPGLDTGCTFRGGGPLVFDIEITRYVGPVDGQGKL